MQISTTRIKRTTPHLRPAPARTEEKTPTPHDDVTFSYRSRQTKRKIVGIGTALGGAALGAYALGSFTSGLSGPAASLVGGVGGAALGGLTCAVVGGSILGRESGMQGLAGALAGAWIGGGVGVVAGGIGGAVLGNGAGNAIGYVAGALVGGVGGAYLAKGILAD